MVELAAQPRDPLQSCLAERVATAYRVRFDGDARDLATRRLQRALLAGNDGKTDLFMAVVSILRDTNGVFSKSRERTRVSAVVTGWLEEIG